MEPEFLFSNITMIAVLFYIFKKSPKHRKLILRDFSTPFFLGNLLIILIFSLYIYYLRDDDEKTEKLKEATKKGLFAMAIAYFARLDLVLTPFWVVWSAIYFYHGWV